MRILSAIAACALVCLVPSGASGETFTSGQFGFRAEFPAEPIVGDPQDSETDASGNFISKSVMIQSRVLGVWTAMVTVDSYSKPAKIDAASTLTAMPKVFAGQLDATVTSSKSGRLDGYKVRYFSYQTRDHVSSGKGIAIVVPAKLPRTYLVLTMHTAQASDENVADLDKFIASFRLN